MQQFATDIKEFIKKYRLRIFSVLLLLFLDLYFFPRQEKLYFEPDITNFKNKCNYAFVTIMLILWATALIIALNKINDDQSLNRFKKFEKRVVAIGGSIILVGVYFLFSYSIFSSLGLFINRQSYKKEIIQRVYTVTDKSKDEDGTFQLYLFNEANNSMEISENDYAVLLQGDKIVIGFKEGWLGADFDPIYIRKLNIQQMPLHH
ncbi:MAG TPA: hypothetical protein VIJ92_13970 [Ginsengibacter sp.]